MAEAKDKTVNEEVITQEAPKELEHITLTENIDDKDVTKTYATADMSPEAKGLFNRISTKQDSKNKLVNAFNIQVDDLDRIMSSLMIDLKKVLPKEVELPKETEVTNEDADSGDKKPN